jgi:ribulose-phosphate 3-epimerase
MSHSVKIAASLLAADFTRLGEQVRQAEAAGADLLHLDVMDGRFVPNLTFGPLIVRAVRSVTTLPLDVHLMIEQPERYVEAFFEAGATQINVHVENCPHLHRLIYQIKDLGIRAGVVLNPHTPFEMIREIMGDVDRVLVMTVNPGFGGQHFIASTLPKIARIAEAIEAQARPVELAVDGGVDAHTTPPLIERGVNVLIAGSAIFGAAGGITTGVAALRTAAKARNG